MSLGLSAAAMNTCQLYSHLEWRVMHPVLNKPALMAVEMQVPLEELMEGLERMERVFAWLALGFTVWAFRSGTPRWPAGGAALAAMCAWIASWHLYV
ncbi:hypothetical protein [Corallococcus caeni]|uniref:hypothetical protein n=1 Tax=Corallococcus caeni TaxID=3082388 RepID=UPI0030C771E6